MLYSFYHPITNIPMFISLTNVRDVRVVEDKTKSKKDSTRFAVRVIHFGESSPIMINGLYRGDACELVENFLKKITENP